MQLNGTNTKMLHNMIDFLILPVDCLLDCSVTLWLSLTLTFTGAHQLKQLAQYSQLK